MTLAYRYGNPGPLVRFHEAEEDARPRMLVYALPPRPSIAPLYYSRRERRAEARKGAGRRRMGAQRVPRWRPPSFASLASETIALDRHVYRAPDGSTVLLYLLAGAAPTDADVDALMVATGWRGPSPEERERAAREEHARRVREAAPPFDDKPNLPPWW